MNDVIFAYIKPAGQVSITLQLLVESSEKMIGCGSAFRQVHALKYACTASSLAEGRDSKCADSIVLKVAYLVN